MNRKLKFRVWWKKYQKFLDTDYVALQSDGYLVERHICYDLATEDGPGWDDSWNEVYNDEDMDEYVIQQSTGLFDSNKVEIYEGDLVRIQTNDDPEDLVWEIDEVVFNNGAFRLKSAICYEDLLQDWITIDNCCELEVVGNVMENSELLEGSVETK